LILIAAMPLSPAPIKHFWEHYLCAHSDRPRTGVAGYFVAASAGWHDRRAAYGPGVFSFISLIGSLFVVAGGIHLKVKGEATPLRQRGLSSRSAR